MALSQDIRGRVIEAYEAKEGSLRELSKRFKVGWITIWRWVKRYRLTGSVKPKPHGKGRRPAVTEVMKPVFQRVIEQHADSTLEELSELFKAAMGIVLSRSTTHRICSRLRMTHKKKSAYAQEQDRADVKKNAKYFKQNA